MRDWLVSELRAMAGPQVCAQFALDLSEERVQLLERVTGGYVLRDEVMLNEPGFANRMVRMRRIVSGRPGAAAKVDLLLPPDLTLYRIESFPGHAKADLRNEVRWRLGTMSGHKPEDLHFDAAIVDEDEATGFLRVSIAIAMKESASEAAEFARSHGFMPMRISARQQDEGFAEGPTFRMATRLRRDTVFLKKSAAVLVVICLVLAVVGINRALWARWEIVEALEVRRQGAEATLAGALQHRQATLALAERASLPLRARTERPLTLTYLNALAESLPPRAKAERVSIDSGILRLEGVAENADAVLSALDITNGFTNARHAAAVVAAATPRMQRFAIEASLQQPASPDAASAPRPEGEALNE
ncbi:MAG: PilN domain-containing protein [Pseudomonadota bacterium]